MSKKNGLSTWYRRISGSILDLMVSPHLIGDIPAPLHHAPTPNAADNSEPAATDVSSAAQNERPICYVLQQYSRSNVLLIDGEARRQSLHQPLAPMGSYLLNEDASIIFLHHRNTNTFQQHHLHPPRLIRLIEALAQNPDLDVDLVPVTVLWGRDPDKEDSLFKLLMAESWQTPSAFRQVLNIGVHGRETYVQFHSPVSLRGLCEQGHEQQPGLSSAAYVVRNLSDYLARQREVVLGPDLSDRRNVVDSLLESTGIQQAIQAEVIRSNRLPDQIRYEARGYLDEIASDYSHSTIKFLERSLTWLWTQLYDGVEVHHFNTVREVAEDHEVVYVPCHRSHIDYLLLSFVIYRRGLMVPYIAAGDNLNMPAVGSILRGGGAFFIRRSFKGNFLYTAVFKEYLHSILSRSTPLEYFIEGGRSRTGRLLPPKTGMLAMTVHSYLRGSSKPIAFVPTYIGYERLMEGGTYVGEMQGKPKEAESIFGLIKAARKIERIFGKVHVSFGEPVYLDPILRAHDADQLRLTRNDEALPKAAGNAINDVANQIMENINRAAVINPVSLLSLVLLSTPKHALDEEVCIKQLDTYKALAESARYDERIEVTALSGREILAYGLKLKLIKRVHHLLGDMISIADNQGVLLTYFRNNILHLFIVPSLIASLIKHNGRISRDEISRIITTLYPFLKAELFLKWRAELLGDVLEREIQALIDAGLVFEDGADVLYSPSPNTEQHNQLSVLAAPVQQSLERYFMTLTLITRQGSGRVSAKQIEDLSHLLGQRLSVLYEFNSPEFFDKALFRSFIAALAEQQYLTIDADGIMHFDHQLETIAGDAHLVLNEDTLNTLQHVTCVTDDEVQAAMNALERKKERKRRS